MVFLIILGHPHKEHAFNKDIMFGRLQKCNMAFPTIQSQNVTDACRAGKF